MEFEEITSQSVFKKTYHLLVGLAEDDFWKYDSFIHIMNQVWLEKLAKVRLPC